MEVLTGGTFVTEYVTWVIEELLENTGSLTVINCLCIKKSHSSSTFHVFSIFLLVSPFVLCLCCVPMRNPLSLKREF